jgi:hypothetical protein
VRRKATQLGKRHRERKLKAPTWTALTGAGPRFPPNLPFRHVKRATYGCAGTLAKRMILGFAGSELPEAVSNGAMGQSIVRRSSSATETF